MLSWIGCQNGSEITDQTFLAVLIYKTTAANSVFFIQATWDQPQPTAY